MSFNYRKYVKSLMLENTFNVSLDSSNYKDDLAYNFDSNTGIYSAVDTEKDPYTYKVTRAASDGVRIKVMSASPNRRSAVGRTFVIRDDNMDNPNVQLLYASIASHEPDKAKLALSASDYYTESNFEVVIGDIDFDYESFFNKQFNKIKSVGKENAKTKLTKVNKVFTINTAELELDNQAKLLQFIESIEKNIEKLYGVIVVSMGIQVDSLPSGTSYLREQAYTTQNPYQINQISVLMKKRALEYFVVAFTPDNSVYITEDTLADVSYSPMEPEQPITVEITAMPGHESKILPDNYVEDTVTYQPQTTQTTTTKPEPEAMTPLRNNEIPIKIDALDHKMFAKDGNVCFEETYSMDKNCYAVNFQGDPASDNPLAILYSADLDFTIKTFYDNSDGTFTVDFAFTGDLEEKIKEKLKKSPPNDVKYNARHDYVTYSNISIEKLNQAIAAVKFGEDLVFKSKYVFNDSNSDLSEIKDFKNRVITLTKM